ncbi:hypothetical protein ACLOJK_005759 [Asimina triloba]
MPLENITSRTNQTQAIRRKTLTKKFHAFQRSFKQDEVGCSKSSHLRILVHEIKKKFLLTTEIQKTRKKIFKKENRIRGLGDRRRLAAFRSAYLNLWAEKK